MTSWSFLSNHAQRRYRCESAPRDAWNGPGKSSRKVTEGPVGTRSEPFCAAAGLIPIKTLAAQIWALCDPKGEI
jgi:hypothetical protein